MLTVEQFHCVINICIKTFSAIHNAISTDFLQAKFPLNFKIKFPPFPDSVHTDSQLPHFYIIFSGVVLPHTNSLRSPFDLYKYCICKHFQVFPFLFLSFLSIFGQNMSFFSDHQLNSLTFT